MDVGRTKSPTLEEALSSITLTKGFTCGSFQEIIDIRHPLEDAEQAGTNDYFENKHLIDLKDLSAKSPIDLLSSAGNPHSLDEVRDKTHKASKQNFLERVFKPRLRNRSPLKYIAPKRAVSYRRRLKRVHLQQILSRGYRSAPPRPELPVQVEKISETRPQLDRHHKPFEGSVFAYEETENQRLDRLEAWEERQREMRSGDKLLAMAGRQLLNNYLIGHAPPLSQNIHSGNAGELAIAMPLDGKDIGSDTKDIDTEETLDGCVQNRLNLSFGTARLNVHIEGEDQASSVYSSTSTRESSFPDNSHISYDDLRHSTLSGELEVIGESTTLAEGYMEIVQEVSQSLGYQCRMRGGGIDELEGETYLGDEKLPSPTASKKYLGFLHDRPNQETHDSDIQKFAHPAGIVQGELGDGDGDDNLAHPFEYERYLHPFSQAQESDRKGKITYDQRIDIPARANRPSQYDQTYSSATQVEARFPALFPPILPAYRSESPIRRLDEGDPYPEDTSFEDAAKWHGLTLTLEASGPTVNPTLLAPSSSHAKPKSFTTVRSSPSSPLVAVFSNLTKAFKRGPKLPIPSSPIPDERTRLEMDNRLTVAPRSEQKTKAVEDARKMQAYVVEECKKSGKDPPPFGLEELIGKGSFGRVYKGKDMTTAKVVAIKIVDIDESDTLNPKNSDAYSEFLKEVNALKLLGENKAKNINLVLEALPVGKAMWMITEHCGGGSVATLMKPTLPNGLLEKWVRTILREAAEGLFWVHQVGIIHRDIKSANVLVTENGDVQLCDFGVAGIIENKTDKRSTIIGTPHWMAPELLTDDRAASYGKEIDIWAFGAMAYEMASGLPPSASIPMSQLQTYLKQNSPRLPEGTYSDDLRDIVAICLQNNPQARPTIEDVQKHRYIYNTSDSYPTGNLRALIHSYRKWESDGGTRKSLFWQHGAQAPVMISASEDDDWNFSVTDDFDDKLSTDFQGMANAYKFPSDDASKTARPAQQQGRPSRRRPPPEALSRGLSVGPLEKLFDPNTLTSYNDNIVARYGKQSDLPLRDDSTDTSIRDTMIDLGGHDVDTGVSSFSDMDTIRADRRVRDESSDVLSTLQDFGRPALSDPADNKDNRRTQDWKFPSVAAPPASADAEVSRFPISYEVPRPAVTPGSGDRPPLIHHPTEPLGSFAFGGGSMGSAAPGSDRMSTRESLIDLDLSQRISMRESLIDLDMGQRASMRESLIDLDMGQRASMRESLIDLDMSMPDPIPAFRAMPELRSIPEFQRPSTANSDVGSTTSEQMTSANPFELERHPSLYLPVQNGREPSIYVSDDTMLPHPLQNGNALHELGDMSDFSGASDAEGYANDRYNAGEYGEENNGYYDDMQSRGRVQQYDTRDDDDRMPPPPRPLQPHPLRTSSRLAMPPLPEPPSSMISTGRADPAEVQAQLTKSIGDITAALQGFRNIYDSQDILQRRGSGMKKDRRDPPPPRA